MELPNSLRTFALLTVGNETLGPQGRFVVRVLCTVAFSAAHARAVLPLVTMLGELGHEVLVAGPASVLAGFADEPVRTAAVVPSA